MLPKTGMSNRIIEYTIECPTKGYLKTSGAIYNTPEIELLNRELKKRYRNRFVQMNKNGAYIFPDPIQILNYSLQIDAFLKRDKNKLTPILVSPYEKLRKKEKVMLSCLLLLLKNSHIQTTPFGRYILGNKQRSVKIKLSTYIDDAKTIIDIMHNNSLPPPFFLKKDCNFCGFFNICREKAVNEDSLSLLTGITQKEIQKWNNKGIFTVTQLSYNFKPRRKSPKKTNTFLKHKFELKALSIRKSRVHVYGNPTLPHSEISVYFDFEGLPGENFIYLIGVVIEIGNSENSCSYWAEKPEDEENIFKKFIKSMDKFQDVVFYHYGNYEIRHLKRIRKKLNEQNQKRIDRIISSCCNLVSYFYSNIYLPIYSNGLKDVGNYLGFQWTERKANGVQSIVWRKHWDDTGSDSLKKTLILYNIEDCHVLKIVRSFVCSIIQNKNESFVNATKLAKESVFEKETALPEIDIIKAFSYFDYQRDKISARTNKAKIKAKQRRRRRRRTRTSLVTNKCMKYRSYICPLCRGRAISKRQVISKKTIDLKFHKTGVKKWIIKHCSHKYYCQNCKKIFTPPSYTKINGYHNALYGHHLKCWVIFQHIVNRESFQQIEFNLWEIFGINVHKGNVIRYKTYFANYYQKSLERIKQKLINGKVLYVDETPFNLKTERGYVWVFTNLDEVLCIYRSNREGGFLKDFLKNFNGVLVTDFYSAYTALDCTQQKCLIHIIRDFNDDLLKNPFDVEFKILAKKFTILLQGIVKTVDKYGLKKEFLKKHIQDVDIFYNFILNERYTSEIAKSYQKRLKKHVSSLFTFIQHDNVSWNNGIAEHAIKILASHSHKTVNSYTVSKIDEYLKIMSLFITCEYKNLSFLKFLLSQKKDIYRYAEKLASSNEVTWKY